MHLLVEFPWVWVYSHLAWLFFSFFLSLISVLYTNLLVYHTKRSKSRKRGEKKRNRTGEPKRAMKSCCCALFKTMNIITMMGCTVVVYDIILGYICSKSMAWHTKMLIWWQQWWWRWKNTMAQIKVCEHFNMDNGKMANAVSLFFNTYNTQNLCSQTNKQTNSQMPGWEMLNVLAHIFMYS